MEGSEEGGNMNWVALNETREVSVQNFQAVKDSGLDLKMVGRPLNSFKQGNDMILDRKATGYVGIVLCGWAFFEIWKNLGSEIVILGIFWNVSKVRL